MPFDNIRSTRNPNIHIARYFENSGGPFYFYKYCKNPSVKASYFSEFENELAHMQNLYQMMRNLGQESVYQKLFPRYSCTGYSKKSGYAYIAMEYVEGQSLEAYLNTRSSTVPPRLLLSEKHLLHLFKQLYDANQWLLKAGMLHIDLHPQNIIILNEDFDIKLIDFTDCYFFHHVKADYHTIDRQVDKDQPIGLQLQMACFSLFTRLFFSGEPDYSHNYSYEFFAHNYASLLPASRQLQAETPLDYFYQWYEALQKLFN